MKSLNRRLQNLARNFPTFFKEMRYRYFSVKGSQKLRCFEYFVYNLAIKAVKKKCWQGFLRKNMKNKTVVFNFQKNETDGTYGSSKENKHNVFQRLMFNF